LFQYCLPFKDGKKVRLVESSNLNEKYFGAEKHESWKSYAVITKSQDSIFAMRKAIVIEIKNEFPTDTLAKGYIYTSKRNSITIEHEDGTYARYSGLKMNSMSVQLGDVVYPSTYLGVLDIFNNKDYVLHFNVYYLAKKDFVYDSKATLRTLKTPYSYLIPYFHTKEGVTKIKNRETYTAHHTPEIITKEMTKKEKKKYFKKNS
jgi:hypothetical protein